MYIAQIRPTAAEDIKKAALWYNRREKGLGKRFTKEVKTKVNLLRKNPFSWSIRYDDIRTAVLEIFPFMIHYAINESQQIITIVAVLHTSRDPDLWKTDNEDFDKDDLIASL